MLTECAVPLLTEWTACSLAAQNAFNLFVCFRTK